MYALQHRERVGDAVGGKHEIVGVGLVKHNERGLVVPYASEINTFPHIRDDLSTHNF